MNRVQEKLQIIGDSLAEPLSKEEIDIVDKEEALSINNKWNRWDNRLAYFCSTRFTDREFEDTWIETGDEYNNKMAWRLYNKYVLGLAAQVWFMDSRSMSEYLAESMTFLKKNLDDLYYKFKLFGNWDEWSDVQDASLVEKILFYEWLQINDCLADLFVDCYLRKNGRWKYWKEKMNKETGPFRKWKTGNEPIYLGAWRGVDIVGGYNQTREQAIEEAAKIYVNYEPIEKEIIASEQKILDFYEKHDV
jgi:hypothetical protein